MRRRARRGREVEVRVAGVAKKRVKSVMVEQYRIDGTHSNAYTAWKAMGSPAHPTAEQTAKLQRAGKLERMGPAQRVEVKDGAARVRVEMPGESVELLRVSW